MQPQRRNAGVLACAQAKHDEALGVRTGTLAKDCNPGGIASKGSDIGFHPAHRLFLPLRKKIRGVRMTRRRHGLPPTDLVHQAVIALQAVAVVEEAEKPQTVVDRHNLGQRRRSLRTAARL